MGISSDIIWEISSARKEGYHLDFLRMGKIFNWVIKVGFRNSKQSSKSDYFSLKLPAREWMENKADNYVLSK